MLKVIIAGGRDFKNFELIEETMREFYNHQQLEIVCGGAKGADALGLLWAQQYDFLIRMFPAEWGDYGNAAGPIRNGQMAQHADELVAFWDGYSRGTKNMIETMQKLDKPIHIVRY